MKKKLLSLILAIALLTGLLPAELISAQAAEADLIAHPVTGGNIYFDPNTGTVTDCDSSVTEANIPTAINGVTVTSIGHEAFSDCWSLSSVTIPESVTTIGRRAFFRCDFLTTVVISGKVSMISDSAFENCYDLTSITLPDSVRVIGIDAFSGCDLREICYAGSETQWKEIDQGNHDFSDVIIRYHTSGPVLINYPVSFGYITFNTQTATIVECGKSVTAVDIPDSIYGVEVIGIGDSAFYNCNDLTNVTIPDGVMTIGDSAFYSCDNLKNITIPGSVTTIGDSAFMYCGSLETITIPDSVVSIGDNAFTSCDSLTSIKIPNNIKTISNSMLYFCSSLKNITIPDGVTTIGDSAFGYCSSLESITIPSSVEIVGNEAFQSCNNLASVRIQDGVVTIGDYAFSFCDSLSSLDIPGSVLTIGDGAFSFCDSLKNVIIPEGVTTIGVSAFEFSSVAKSITIPASVTVIGEYAFSGCAASEGIWVDKNNPNYSNDEHGFLFNKDKTELIAGSGTVSEHYIIPNGVKTIRDGAFYSSGLENITIPNSVELIGMNAFNSCKCLTNVTIPGGITTIGVNAFANCENLTSVIVESGVETIGKNAFADCWSLKDVKLPQGLIRIEDEAFWNCREIDSVTIPNSVILIGTWAFDFYDGCYLSAIYYTGSEEQWMEIDIGYNEFPTVHFNICEHRYGEILTQPTCTENGYTTYTCSDCGDSYVEDGAAPLGHNHKSEVTKPTCTEEGYTTYTCTRCGESYEDDFTDKADHTWNSGEITKEPSEEADGIRTFSCTVCGETKTESVPYVPGHEHSYTEVVTKPTCTESGYTTYTCECGNIYTGNVVDALDHDFKAGVCSRCGAEDPDYTENELLKNFKDMPDENNWAYDGIVYCVEKGLMNGISETAFSPNGTVSRAQLVTILYRAAGSPATEFKGTFTDVPDGQWYSKAIEWAAANGVVNGIGDGKFGPDQSITREQIATILYRYENQPAVSGSLDSFPDKGNVSGFAVTGMIWATGEKLINGVSSNGVTSLAPKNNATRAQIAAIIMRYLEN